MPRTSLSPAGKTLTFFQTAPMENAELVLGLATDAVRARQHRSQEAKARAHKPNGSSAVSAAPKPARAKKRKAAKPAPVSEK